MTMKSLGTINPAALAVPAKQLAVASRDAAAGTLARDHMIPQTALGLSLQACTREAGLLGELDVEDVVEAFGSALAGVLFESTETRSHQNRLADHAIRALWGSLDAVRRERRGRA